MKDKQSLIRPTIEEFFRRFPSLARKIGAGIIVSFYPFFFSIKIRILQQKKKLN